MLKRKGGECPSLANISWEFFSKATDSGDPESFTMRCKPVFVLSDAFMKANSIPRKKGEMKPTLAPSETINFHKLALRYSTTLTKDMIFTTFTALVRKIGEIIGTGRIVKLPFSVGHLLSKDKKTKFIFNAEALKMQGGENPVVFSMKKPSAAASSSTTVGERSGSADSGKEDGAANASQNEVPQSAAPQVDDPMAMTNLNAIPQDDYPEDPPIDPLDPLPADTTTSFAVQEEAYERYISKLEDDAVAESKLNQLLVDLQEEKDEKKRQKDAKAVKLLKDMQTSQLEQWAQYNQARDEEKTLRKAKYDTSIYPRRDQKEDEDVGRAKLQNPYGVPVTRKFLGLPGVPKKGMGYQLSKGELVADLNAQISLKESRVQAEKAMKEEEERRYIEHVAMELDYDNQAKQLEAVSKKRELMAAWQREAFLKKMLELRMKGDIEGLRKHHSEHKMRLSGSVGLPSLDVGRGSGNQKSSERREERNGGFADAVSVGFDSRK